MIKFMDYSRARPTVDFIKGKGCSGVVRYLSDRDINDGDINPKDIQKPEAAKLLAAGIRIALVWETSAARAGAGAAAGKEDAIDAEAQATALGYPAGATILYAVDYDATVAQVKPYLDAVIANAKRPAGLYGGYDMIHGYVHHGSFKYGWQTRAWSEGVVCDTGTHLYQNVFSGDYDISDVLQENFLAVTWTLDEPEPERIPVVTGQLAPIITGGAITTPYKEPGSMWIAGYHPGEDWNASNDLGKPAYSAVDGKVVHSGTGGWGAAFGRHVIVEDETGERTAHCHLSKTARAVGQTVRAGSLIGYVGATGHVTGPHVHVERRHKPFGYWDHERPLRDLPRPKEGVINVSHLVERSFCDSVYWLQRALNAVPLVSGRNLRRSGRFDADVKAEVIKFQTQKAGATGDGLLTLSQTQQLMTLAGHQIEVKE